MSDHATVSEWAQQIHAWAQQIKLLVRESKKLAEELEELAELGEELEESIERKMADSTGALDHLFDEVDDVGVPTRLALFLAALNERDRLFTAYDLQHALLDAGKHDLYAMVESWLVGEEARREEEKKERYREKAASLAGEGASPERVTSLAAHLQREDDRSFAKYSRAVDARRLLEYWMAKDMAADLPPEPPVILERKALNQLDKRETRKLARPKEAKDDEEHRENKQQERELRNAMTKVRNQKRAKARANKLAA